MSTFLTLDRFMQAPGGPEEDTNGQLTSGDWTVTSCDEAVGRTMGVVMATYRPAGELQTGTSG